MVAYGEQEASVLYWVLSVLVHGGAFPIHRGSFHVSTTERKKGTRRRRKNQTS